MYTPDFEIEPLLSGCSKRPCYNCSRFRRKAILEFAESRNITKIVFAHHRDDVIETFFMNMLYQDEISTMVPKQKLFDGKFEIIRPLYLVPEYLIQKYADELKLPVAKNPCSFSNDTKRTEVRKLLKTIQNTNSKRDMREHIFKSILNVNTEFMP
jgi:tRNA 2-thiocytidine biosynthesis protein TtcA